MVGEWSGVGRGPSLKVNFGRGLVEIGGGLGPMVEVRSAPPGRLDTKSKEYDPDATGVPYLADQLRPKEKRASREML